MVVEKYAISTLSDLHEKQVTLYYGKDEAPADFPWETLIAKDKDGNLYVLISREVTE